MPSPTPKPTGQLAAATDPEKGKVRRLLSSTTRIRSLFVGRLSPILTMLVVSAIVCLPWLGNGLPNGHDLTFHLYRYQGTINALDAGQVIPLVDPRAVGGYGYGYNIFYGPLTAYLVAPVQMLVNNWQLSVGLFCFVSLAISGYAMYALCRLRRVGQIGATVAGAVYIAAPYHVVDLLAREAHGELFAMTAIPIALVGLQLIVDRRRCGVLVSVIGLGAIILSHNLSAVIFAPFAVAYVLLQWRKLRNLRTWLGLGAAAMLTLGVTSFFTLPILEAARSTLYVAFDPTFAKLFRTEPDIVARRALTIGRLFFNDSYSSQEDLHNYALPLAIGMVFVAAPVVLWILRGRLSASERSLSTSCAVLAGVALLLSTTLFPWSLMPSALTMVQFPWRYLAIATVFLSVLAGLAAEKLLARTRAAVGLSSAPSRFAIVALATALAIVPSSQMIGWATYRTSGEGLVPSFDYRLGPAASRFGKGTGVAEEYLPSSLKRLGVDALKSRGRVVVGDSAGCELTEFDPKATVVRVRVKAASTDCRATVPLVFYPGYRASLSQPGHRSQHLTVSPSAEGLVQVLVPSQSDGELMVYYGLSTATRFGLVTTAVSWAFLVAGTVLVFRRGVKRSVTVRPRRI